jgi:hypothetical protein
LNLRAALDAVERRKFLILLGLELPYLGLPIRTGYAIPVPILYLIA